MKCPPLTLSASSAENLFLILRLLRSAERSKRFFTRGAVKANSNALRSAALPKEAALQMLFPVTTSPVKMQCRSVRRRSGIALLKIIFPLQRRRPPPAAETGSSCWGSGQQDASAAQGTMRMLGAATRKTRRAFKIVPRASLPDMPHPLFCARKVWYTENSILCPEGG